MELGIPKDSTAPRYVVRVTRWDGTPPNHRRASIEVQVHSYQNPYQRKPVKPVPRPQTFMINPDNARELAQALIAIADEMEQTGEWPWDDIKNIASKREGPA